MFQAYHPLPQIRPNKASLSVPSQLLTWKITVSDLKRYKLSLFLLSPHKKGLIYEILACAGLFPLIASFGLITERSNS